MSVILIVISGLLSLAVGYFVALPFLSEVDCIEGSYLEILSVDLKESYTQSLEDLERAREGNIIDDSEYFKQKELLLKDAHVFLKDT